MTLELWGEVQARCKAVGVGQCMAVLRHLTPNGLFVRRGAFASHDASTGGGISTESNLQAMAV